jgi:glycosyltransferase involved in cell wall biosynthesis
MIAPTLLKKIGYLRGPLICSVRGALIYDAHDTKKPALLTWAIRQLERYLLRHADLVVANGWDTQDYLSREHGCASEVIPNGLDLNAERRNPDDPDLDILTEVKASGRLLFLHVGTVRRVKGIDAILDAYAQLPSALADRTRLVFVGKGQISQYLDKCAGVQPPPLFLGEKGNVDDYYDVADFVLNVSGGSGVSNSLLETLAHGVPVICWDRKTFTQVITQGVNGLTCPQSDIHSLTRAMGDAITGKFLFDADTVRSTVAGFTWDRIGMMWLSVLAGKRTGSIHTELPPPETGGRQ